MGSLRLRDWRFFTRFINRQSPIANLIRYPQTTPHIQIIQPDAARGQLICQTNQEVGRGGKWFKRFDLRADVGGQTYRLEPGVLGGGVQEGNGRSW